MRDDSSVLVRITPYPKAEYEDNTESLDSYYDEVEVCQESCSAHFKAAITIKNIIKRVLQTKVNSQKEKSPAKFARPKKGIAKQAGKKMYRQPGWNWQLA